MNKKTNTIDNNKESKVSTSKKTKSSTTKKLSSKKTTNKKTTTTKATQKDIENTAEPKEIIDVRPIQEIEQQQTIKNSDDSEQISNLENNKSTVTSETPENTIIEQPKNKQEAKVPTLPDITINNIIELSQAPLRSIILTDQQIQSLTLDEIKKRHSFLQHTLTNVLDYDVVISDTNIWIELLLGHTSSHSDPRYNARLQFERQLEFISKLTKYRGGRFMMLSETYEEIDRFATMLDPTDYREADFTDNQVCLNTAARLAKRLILSQQRENRLRIDNISAESHHASFADPAIIRSVVDLFATGKKVLVLTNDTSVAIRSIGICDDLQRHNNISDDIWNEKYAPLRPMVFTFDDLKLLDFYTRQYHYIQMASGQPWMSEISHTMNRQAVEPLTLWLDAFRPGDKHRSDNLFTESEQKQMTQKQQQKQQRTSSSGQQKKIADRTNTTPTEDKKEENATEKVSEQPKETNVADNTKKELQKSKKAQRRKPQSKKQEKNEEKTA